MKPTPVTIDHTILASPEMCALSVEARYLYAALLPWATAAGCVHIEPAMVRAYALKHLKSVDSEVLDWANELLNAGVIFLFNWGADDIMACLRWPGIQYHPSDRPYLGPERREAIPGLPATFVPHVEPEGLLALWRALESPSAHDLSDVSLSRIEKLDLPFARWRLMLHQQNQDAVRNINTAIRNIAKELRS